MRKIFTNNLTKLIYLLFSTILSLYMILMIIMALVGKGNFGNIQRFSIPGLLLSVIINIYLLVIIMFEKKDNYKINYKVVKIFKWVVLVASVLAAAASIAYVSRIYYVLNHYNFPQAVGMDQSAYLAHNLPYITISIISIVLDVFACFISFYLIEDKTKSINEISEGN